MSKLMDRLNEENKIKRINKQPKYVDDEQYFKDEIEEKQEDLIEEPLEQIDDEPTFEEDEPEIFEVKDNVKTDNPHELYRSIVKSPVPKGLLKEKLGKDGYTLDFAAFEKYLIYFQTPRKMRNYMRYQKAMTIEDVKGFSKRPKVKFSWGLIWLIIGAVIMLMIGLFFVNNPDFLSDIFGDMFGGLGI